MLVNTGSIGAPVYGVLSSTDPAANTLALEKPDLGGANQDGVAGRLFLTMDFQPTPMPTPFSSDGETSDTTERDHNDNGRFHHNHHTRHDHDDGLAATSITDR